MQDTKAIRPEIMGLFETIREQAIKYAEAFDVLESKRIEYEHFIKELKKLNHEVYASVGNEIFNLKQKYDDLTKVLKIENTKISQKYLELSDLKKLQDSYFSALESIRIIQTSLEQQFNMLKQGSEEYLQNIDSIKKSADSKVEEYLKDSFEKVETSVKSQYQKFEEKITTKIRQIDGKIINNDEVYWAFQERYKTDLKRILEEFDEFRRNMLNIELSHQNSADSGSITNISKKFQEKQDKIEENLTVIYDKISNLYALVHQGTGLSQKSDINPKTNNYNKLQQDNDIVILNQFKAKIIQLEKKVNMVNYIAWASGVIAVIAIILLIL